MAQITSLFIVFSTALLLLSGAEGATQAGVAADRKATPETQALYAWINGIRRKAFIGSQYGHGPGQPGWNDLFALSGRMPLLFAAEYVDSGPAETNKNDMGEIRGFLLDNFRAGGINSIHDHMPNFSTGGSHRDLTGEVLLSILPGGSAHHSYTAYLDRFATFIDSLKSTKSHAPILYRPFHEMNGEWFWWGGAKNSEAFVRVWRWTFDYLINVKECHNLLWVWSPNISNQPSTAMFDRYWPGSDYVDIVGLDGYDNRPRPNFGNAAMVGSYLAVSSIAAREGKPFAWTELGFEQAARRQRGFWSADFLKNAIASYDRSKYFVLWNSDMGPAPGNTASESARKMLGSGFFLLRGDAFPWEVYGNSIVSE